MVKKIKESRMFRTKSKKKSKLLGSKTKVLKSKSLGSKLKGALKNSPLKVGYVTMVTLLILTVAGYSGMEVFVKKNAAAYNPAAYDQYYFYAYARKLNGWGCSWGPYLIPATLTVGSRGNCVRYLQSFLNRFNYFVPERRIAEDGVYGPQTATRVREYQDWQRYFRRSNLGTDGAVGPATWTSIYYCYDPVASGGQNPSNYEYNRIVCYAGGAPWN